MHIFMQQVNSKDVARVGLPLVDAAVRSTLRSGSHGSASISSITRGDFAGATLESCSDWMRGTSVRTSSWGHLSPLHFRGLAQQFCGSKVSKVTKLFPNRSKLHSFPKFPKQVFEFLKRARATPQVFDCISAGDGNFFLVHGFLRQKRTTCRPYTYQVFRYRS